MKGVYSSGSGVAMNKIINIEYQLASSSYFIDH